MRHRGRAEGIVFENLSSFFVMADEFSGEVTQILQRGGGDGQSFTDELLPRVYPMRRLAHNRMANEAPGQTLQPTALVHEA